MCDRFHVIPDVAYGMDASVLRLLRIEQLGSPEPMEGGEDVDGWRERCPSGCPGNG